MSNRVKAVIASWQPAPDGATWVAIDAAWWVLAIGLDLASRLDKEERS